MEKFPEDHNNDDSSRDDGQSTPPDLVTPRTPHTVLIDAEPSSSDRSDSESPGSDQPSKTPAAQDALDKYLSAQRSALRKDAHDVIADLDALRRGHNWTFGQDFAPTVTALTQASGFLNTASTASTDVSRAIKQIADDAKKVSPPPTEEIDKLVSFKASTLMYLATFFLGRWLTTATGCGILLSGAGGQLALAVLVNNLVVPLTQAMLGDPMGAALRNYGPNVPSEDSRHYANFMTAHALYVRSCISGVYPKDYDPLVEMDRIINEVAWREQGRPDQITKEPTAKGTWFASGVKLITHPKKPADEVTADLKATPYSVGERARVVSSMLARILVADEAPVHAFSLFNGVTGMLGNLWPTLFGATTNGLAVSRAVDAAMHTTAGAFAMFVMFQMQDQLRPIVQSAQRVDPTDEEYLKLKQAPFSPIVRAAGNKQDALSEVADALARLRSQLKMARDLLDPKSPDRDRLEHLQSQVKGLQKRYKQKINELNVEIDAAVKDVRMLDSPGNKLARGVLDTWRAFSGRTPKSANQSWVDGSPSVVRAFSKYLGYATALVPSTVMSIEVSRGIGAAYLATKQQVTDQLNSAVAMSGPLMPAYPSQYKGETQVWTPPLPAVNPSDVILTPEQIAAAHNPYLTASAFNATVAIVGWNLRNVAFDPMYQHIIHAGIGLAERGFGICCGGGGGGGEDAAANNHGVDVVNVLASSHRHEPKEAEDALEKVLADLKSTADELRHLGGGVMGDVAVDMGTGETGSPLSSDASRSVSGSDSDSGSHSDSDSDSGSGSESPSNRMD